MYITVQSPTSPNVPVFWKKTLTAQKRTQKLRNKD